MSSFAFFLLLLFGLTSCSGRVQMETSSTSSSGATGGGGETGAGGGAGGTGGTGGTLVGSDRTSCAGKKLVCAGQSCCAYTNIPGGTYNRLNDPAYPATVSDFQLDVFEVTVGRMRSFVEAYPGSLPVKNAGAHPSEPASGWYPNYNVPPTQAILRSILAADGFAEPQFATWTESVGANENRPIVFVTWELAQAFCIWDGGRLPTEAEWNYAATGGEEQRKYPWGEEPPTPKLAALNFGEPNGPYTMVTLDVGSLPAGAGRWAQVDLSGSRSEILFDANNSLEWDGVSDLPVPCNDCLVLQTKGAGRIVRDTSYLALANLAHVNEERDGHFELSQVDAAIGFRCVYAPDGG